MLRWWIARRKDDNQLYDFCCRKDARVLAVEILTSSGWSSGWCLTRTSQSQADSRFVSMSQRNVLQHTHTHLSQDRKEKREIWINEMYRGNCLFSLHDSRSAATMIHRLAKEETHTTWCVSTEDVNKHTSSSNWWRAHISLRIKGRIHWHFNESERFGEGELLTLLSPQV